MARFELHTSFAWPKDSEIIASADWLSDVIRVWEDDPDAAFGYVVRNTEDDTIVWRPDSVAVFPAVGADGGHTMSLSVCWHCGRDIAVDWQRRLVGIQERTPPFRRREAVLCHACMDTLCSASTPTRIESAEGEGS